MTEYTAIEITAPKVVEILTCFDPTLAELDYAEDLHQNFIVCNFPEPGAYAIVKADRLLDETFDHIEPGMKIKLVQIFKN